MGTGLFKNIGLKLNLNLIYRRVIILLIILFVTLLVAYGLLLYQFKIINLTKIEMYKFHQERELYISKFYNSFNKNELINELYSITKDDKYLKLRSENLQNMDRDFDSLYSYCREREDYCARLDTSRYFLDHFVNQVMPESDSIINLLHQARIDFIEIKKIRPGIFGFQYETISINTSEQEKIRNYLTENLKVVGNEILKPTQWIVRNDRVQNRQNQKSVDEKIKLYDVLQKSFIGLLIGAFILLILAIIYIVSRPLDKPLPVMSTLPNKQYSAIYERFEDELIEILMKAKDLFSKYDEIHLIFPRGSFFPIEIISALQKFCLANSFVLQVQDTIKNGIIVDKHAFVLLEDETLVQIIESTRRKNLTIGKQVGILAYGDSPLKRIVAHGITVIDTLFENTELTTIRERKRIPKNFLSLIDRNSL
jgi:hypothetical protein